ncbi:hypothetical protein BDQ17DRAFT_1432110 [Cyathus striatus]|nr:hypothetical protein BDQ17DRAFT_1432110 [Cyathus striatus]
MGHYCYWAVYGYDANSPQFKEWAASQAAQYARIFVNYFAAGAAPAVGATPTARSLKLRQKASLCIIRHSSNCPPSCI